MQKIRWGILGTAKIAREKVIPAMRQCTFAQVTAIASRSMEQALQQAALLNIPAAYGSYEEILASPDIDAIYIPLPNHLHVEWSLKAIAAGKHVLCEKPLGLSVADAITLVNAANVQPQIKVMEAFMYRFHPQWVNAKKLVDLGMIGTLKTIQSFFSYFNNDPLNIRNQKNAGGGGLMDIGCYCISLSRFLFNKEPERVCAIIENDPLSETDRHASAIMDFGTGTSSFTCSTQMMPYQRVNILGTEGRIEIEVPFNAMPDKFTRCQLITKNGSEEISFEATDQYTLQVDAFCLAIINNTPVPTPLHDAVNNMKVIDALFASAKNSQWQPLP